MTAIAGCVALGPGTNLESVCQTSLEALRLYGSRQSVAASSQAAFGVNLCDLLPEDRFSRSPYRNERYLFVADVRLDNRDELIEALGEPRANDRSSDSEILFHAWCRWGERSLDRIAGDYAFAVHDAASGQLFLVRDHTGQRPLFYTIRPNGIFFATMPSGLLMHQRPSHDVLQLARRLAACDLDDRSTYFEGVERVLPGQVVVFTGERCSTRPYWTPDTEELSGRSSAHLVEELRDRLDSAVSSRMRRVSGPIATHLSSGWDSSAVTATAARLRKRGEQLIAFTSAPSLNSPALTVPRRIVDESPAAAAAARAFCVDHEVVRAGGPLLDVLRNHSRYYQEPVRNVLNMAWWAQIQREARGRGAQVILTAEMGNLTLNAGGLPVLAEWVRRGSWLRWFRQAFHASRRADVRWRGVLMNSFHPWMPAALREGLIHSFLGQPPWLSSCFVRPELLKQIAPARDRPSTSPAAERLRIIRSFDTGVFRKGSLAMNGVDERDPTADRRLIEFSLQLPPEQLLQHRVFKPLARAALEDRVPQFVLDAPVRGYQGADWFSRLAQADALAVLEEVSSSHGVQELLDLPRLRQRAAMWPYPGQGPAMKIESFGRQLTNALSMAVFVQETEQRPEALGV